MVQTGPITKRKLERITKGWSKMTKAEEAAYRRIYGVENERTTTTR